MYVRLELGVFNFFFFSLIIFNFIISQQSKIVLAEFKTASLTQLDCNRVRKASQHAVVGALPFRWQHSTAPRTHTCNRVHIDEACQCTTTGLLSHA